MVDKVSKFGRRAWPMENILQAIGQTPLVKLNRIPQSEGIQCQVYAKCEFMNPGGSVKDRIAQRMIEEAERQGVLKPGHSVIIEPTSGNTGIGLAMAGAIKGYRVIITLPEKMSDEKVNLLLALGAEVHRTPTEAAWDAPESHISLAQRLRDTIPGAVILDQYGNEANPQVHAEETAAEVWAQMDSRLDMIVAGAGTGGTIAGLEQSLRQWNPAVRVVGVDPKGSLLAGPCEACTPYLVEGIGYDFIPQVLQPNKIDCWVKTEDGESFVMARRLIREEGLLVGGSCGAAMVGAIRAIKQAGWANDPNRRVCVILPDSIRNYMSKFLSDDWMQRHGMPRLNLRQTVYGLPICLNRKPLKTVSKDCPIEKLKCELKDQEIILVLDSDNEIYGYASTQTILKRLLSMAEAERDSLQAARVLSREFGLAKQADSADALQLLASGVPVFCRAGDGSQQYFQLCPRFE